MSKALVIKGADFSTHKVATVTLSEVIPCTGIILTPNTVSLSSVGATTTLTPNLTPAGATETVYWASSDANVCSVADGVLTCTGVGSCTITATCGSYSATCAVTNVIVIDAATELSYENTLAIYPRDGYDYISNQYGAKIRTYYDPNNTLNGLRMGASADYYSGKYPVGIPAGTSTIKVYAPVGFDRTCRYALVDSQTNAEDTNDPCAKVYSWSDQVGPATDDDGSYFEISMTGVNENVDALAISLRSATTDAADLGTNVQFKFY